MPFCGRHFSKYRLRLWNHYRSVYHSVLFLLSPFLFIVVKSQNKKTLIFAASVSLNPGCTLSSLKWNVNVVPLMNVCVHLCGVFVRRSSLAGRENQRHCANQSIRHDRSFFSRIISSKSALKRNVFYHGCLWNCLLICSFSCFSFSGSFSVFFLKYIYI